jgi:hypothetical protein
MVKEAEQKKANAEPGRAADLKPEPKREAGVFPGDPRFKREPKEERE